MTDEEIRKFFSTKPKRIAALRNDLESLLETYSGDRQKAAETADLIIAKYSEKHRVYHNLTHILMLIHLAELHADGFADRESARLAVWFHDAIYESQSRTNEIDSARLAVQSLTELNFPKAKIQNVEKMILATEKHDASETDADGKIFLDMDLGILGANENLYVRYAKAIRLEYAFVPEDLYRSKRREILEAFLQREFIYYTDLYREYREEGARRNIANEIKELS